MASESSLLGLSGAVWSPASLATHRAVSQVCLEKSRHSSLHQMSHFSLAQQHCRGTLKPVTSQEELQVLSDTSKGQTQRLRVNMGRWPRDGVGALTVHLTCTSVF